MGDIVQVFLESMETPEGDMLVSGQQAAQERRFRAVWKELEERMERKLPVKGAHCAARCWQLDIRHHGRSLRIVSRECHCQEVKVF